MIYRGGVPVPGFALGSSPVGLGQEIAAPSAGLSPVALALATSVIGATTGWVLDTIVHGKRKRR